MELRILLEQFISERQQLTRRNALHESLKDSISLHPASFLSKWRQVCPKSLIWDGIGGFEVVTSLLQGNYLDTLARKYLWDVGLNYMHGTGHGVGAFLNVHEQPIGMSWRPYPDDPGLQVGMFLSNGRNSAVLWAGPRKDQQGNGVKWAIPKMVLIREAEEDYFYNPNENTSG